MVRPWTVDNWQHVVFSDESRFTLFKCDNRTVVWREKRERYEPACLVNHAPASRNGIMFWGCIGYHGVGSLVEVEQTLNSVRYVEVLEDNLHESIENIFGDAQQNFVFQQDNAPCHSSRYTQDWLHRQNFQNMQWPSNSPDMNIVESVWGHIAQKLRENPPVNLRELRHKVHTIWASITPEYIQGLYHQIPRRVRTLIVKRGYPTQY